MFIAFHGIPISVVDLAIMYVSTIYIIDNNIVSDVVENLPETLSSSDPLVKYYFVFTTHKHTIISSFSLARGNAKLYEARLTSNV